MADDLSSMYELVAGRLLSGKIVPVLGAGANLGDRPPDVGYQRGRYLPSGRELAEKLARFVHYPMAGVLDLARVSQYVAAQLGESSSTRSSTTSSTPTTLRPCCITFSSGWHAIHGRQRRPANACSS